MEDFKLGKGKSSKLDRILQKLGRSRSVHNQKPPKPLLPDSKSKSWPRSRSLKEKTSVQKGKVAPEGCFTVYVGSEKERFVLKTDYINHPLFRVLLEEAEMEYGFNSDGPLVLPCEVDYFNQVLIEMHNDKIHGGCAFPKGLNGYQLLSPTRIGAG
ncbi:hypothetical protein AMTRI_Chr06g170210 [Amborella trichopoda]|uniref:Auxin-responsive protein n=1 Tax=Amborella trichopoda TaxID=13333 RepID=W1P8S8_AMBTC|nr:auxin-responsive protein SAUR71 [Amborella trichopoda]XP_020523049.1 auxin-responsive protein SAUR71 [Amborella trichopoda]ERN06272.1 hypothetical protein AMTR_s00016p00212020 [Amborella trichopoda]|eukprot:XP_011623445.1 auxin-responsive protein SAUR71 [Amborella trichopoda]